MKRKFSPLARFAACGLVLILSACGGGTDPAADTVVASDAAQADSGQTQQSSPPAQEAQPPASESQSQTPAVPPAPSPPPFVPDPALGAMSQFMLSERDWLAIDEQPGTDDSPHILTLHDLASSSVQWRRLRAALPQDWHWLHVDLRGFGNASDPPDGTHTLTEHLDDLSRLLASRPGIRFTVVASGLGARLALALAQARPEHIDRLVLTAADDGSAPSVALRQLADRLDAESAQADDALLIDWRAAGIITGDELAPAGLRLTTATWKTGLDALSRADPSLLLSNIKQPVLRILGSSDGLVTADGVTALANRLRPDVERVVTGAGRYPELDATAEVADLLTRFTAERGRLHASRIVGSSTAGQTNTLTDGRVERALVRDVTGEAFCDVDFVEIEYQSVGAAGESTNASAVIGAPRGGHPECQGARPLLLYAHGTSADRNYDFATSAEGFGGIALAMFAARGYIVVAPQYQGYGKSWLDYHPYLQADAQSADMVDALRAAEQWLVANGRSRQELFLSGYSQGGYVAMATHRRIERDHADEFTVTGSFPMSGPYALERTFSQILSGRRVDAATELVPFILDGLLRAKPDLGPASRYLAAPYDKTSIGLFPGSIGTDEALDTGLIPPYLLPDQGTPFLIKSTAVIDYLDAPESALRAEFFRNSLLDWTPRAPLGLCGGGKDPLVFFDNSFVARDAFLDKGVVVPVFDLNNSASLPSGRANSMYLRFRSLFLFTRDLSRYHTALAPFCAHFARDFFRDLRR